MLKKLVCVVALLGMIPLAHAQKSLGELAAEAGVDWLVGDWESVGDSGNAIQLSFKAEMDNHIGIVHRKDARSESKGIVLFDPGANEVKFYSGDNRGGAGTGVWTVEDNKAVLKYKHTAADGQTYKVAATFRKVDGSTMEVKLYELTDGDKMGDEARSTVTFKRKK